MNDENKSITPTPETKDLLARLEEQAPGELARAIATRIGDEIAQQVIRSFRSVDGQDEELADLRFRYKRLAQASLDVFQTLGIYTKGRDTTVSPDGREFVSGELAMAVNTVFEAAKDCKCVGVDSIDAKANEPAGVLR